MSSKPLLWQGRRVGWKDGLRDALNSNFYIYIYIKIYCYNYMHYIIYYIYIYMYYIFEYQKNEFHVVGGLSPKSYFRVCKTSSNPFCSSHGRWSTCKSAREWSAGPTNCTADGGHGTSRLGLCYMDMNLHQQTRSISRVSDGFWIHKNPQTWDWNLRSRYVKNQFLLILWTPKMDRSRNHNSSTLNSCVVGGCWHFHSSAKLLKSTKIISLSN